MTRTAFLGTPESAVPTLEALVERSDVEIVITQPDRPRGRSGTPSPSPVKEAAGRLGLTVAQPSDSHSLASALLEAGPIDTGVVVAYGRILPPDVLGIPRAGFLNVHFSLLPRWRGAAPVARALMSGDRMTGVTIIELDEGLDSGPVLTAQAVDVGDEEDAGTLTHRLAGVGARLIVTVLDNYSEGLVVPVPQSDEGLTYATKITSADRPVGPDMSVADFVNRVRGLAPTPGAILCIDGSDHKVLAARQTTADVLTGQWSGSSGVPVVGLSDGAVELLLVQASGRRVVAGDAWLRGHQTVEGRIG